METYTETVYRYRVMRQLSDKERNPDGNWTLVYSTESFPNALDVLKDQADSWAKCGDAFKIVHGKVETIERPMW